MPTVKVDSSYSHEFEPDVMHVSVRMEGTAPTKAEASAKYNRCVKKVLAALEGIGIPRDEVRSGYFGVWQLWSKNGKGEGFEFSGYQEFDTDCDEGHFDAIWNALMYLDGEDGVLIPRFTYGLRDEEGAREQIVQTTVELGRRRAALLADAVGCELGQISSISDSLHHIRLSSCE